MRPADQKNGINSHWNGDRSFLCSPPLAAGKSDSVMLMELLCALVLRLDLFDSELGSEVVCGLIFPLLPVVPDAPPVPVPMGLSRFNEVSALCKFILPTLPI